MGRLLAYPRFPCPVSFMKQSTSPGTVSFQLNLDERRRPMLAIDLLNEAGIDINSSMLVAHAEGVGRIVLEDPLAYLDALGARVTQEMRDLGITRTLGEDLQAFRAADTSLDS